MDAALEIARGFNDITRVVERMAQRQLSDRDRSDFAAQALTIRHSNHEQNSEAPAVVSRIGWPRRPSHRCIMF